jgi:hypothetical protein
MRVTARASVTVAVFLCGVAMLTLWSSRAVPSRGADEGALRARRESPPPSFEKVQVNLDVEKRLRESPSQPSRDPFRFYVRPVPPTPHIRQVALVPPTTFEPAPPAAPPAAPMPWKLMGIVQLDTMRWAVFSDCRGMPIPVAEGGSLVGQWRVTTIGVESVTLQSLDDRRIDLPLRGCQPR